MPMTMAVPQAQGSAGATGATDQFPSGSWGFGPINIKWSVKDNNEIDIDVSVLGIDVDDLTGTLTSNSASLSDTLDVLGIVKGTLGLTAKWNQGAATDGLWISGQVTAGTWSSGTLNHRIVPW